MANSFGWDGAGVGLKLETTYGTEAGVAGTMTIWTRIESEGVLVDDPPKRRRTIFPSSAAYRGTFPTTGRYQGIPAIGGPIVLEGVYQGLDHLFHDFFGRSTQTGTGPYTHQYNGTVEGNLVTANTKPSVSFLLDRDDTSLMVLGGKVEQLDFEVVPEEAMKVTATVFGQTGTAGTGVAPSFATQTFIEDHECVLYVDTGSEAAIDMDGYKLTLKKAFRKVPAHDGTNRQIRQPIVEKIVEISGQFVRLWDGNAVYTKFRAGTHIGIRLTATDSTNTFELDIDNAAIMKTGPETADEGPRVETVDFEADTDGSTIPVKLKTVNSDDESSWA